MDQHQPIANAVMKELNTQVDEEYHHRFYLMCRSSENYKSDDGGM